MASSFERVIEDMLFKEFGYVCKDERYPNVWELGYSYTFPAGGDIILDRGRQRSRSERWTFYCFNRETLYAPRLSELINKIRVRT
jgi:hypothetical protein